MTLRPRCVVLGLDGVPLSLARTLAPELPNLGSLALSPKASELTSELPELSPVNWTSFFTAAGPGEHGVYGFSRLDPASYEVAVADFTQVAGPTIFDRLGEHGLISKVINLPNTYPARPIRGMLVSGFVAQDLARAVYPPFLLGPLRAAGYILEADTARTKDDPDLLLAELNRVLDSRERALDLFWPDLAWDLFVFVLTETDRLFHFLYPAVEDPGHALHGACLGFLRRWDRVIGRVLERYAALPEPKRLLVLADHGFTTLKTEVDLNSWLRERGLLDLAPPLPGEDPRSEAAEWQASRITARTRAFALDPSRIYVHDARFSRGPLSRPEAARLGQDLRQALLSLTHEGVPVMEAVHFGPELYHGAQAWRAPDLVCLARPGFDLKAKFNRDQVFGRFGRLGAHTARGAIFYDSQGAKPGLVREVGREVLDWFGLASAQNEERPKGAPVLDLGGES